MLSVEKPISEEMQNETSTQQHTIFNQKKCQIKLAHKNTQSSIKKECHTQKVKLETFSQRSRRDFENRWVFTLIDQAGMPYSKWNLKLSLKVQEGMPYLNWN